MYLQCKKEQIMFDNNRLNKSGLSSASCDGLNLLVSVLRVMTTNSISALA